MLNSVFSQAQPQGNYQVAMTGLILVLFFVGVILPNFLKKRNEKKFQKSLEKGDKVILDCGLHGKIL